MLLRLERWLWKVVLMWIVIGFVKLMWSDLVGGRSL